MQYGATTPVAGVSQALVIHLQAAEIAIMAALDKLQERSLRLPEGVELIWQETPNYISAHRRRSDLIEPID